MLWMVLSVVAACLLDRILGEPKKWHPLVGYGNYLYWLEKRLNPDSERDNTCQFDTSKAHQANTKRRGITAWCLAVVPIVAATGAVLELLFYGSFIVYWIICTLVLYVCIGQKSLLEHASWIHRPLVAGDMEQAREKVGWIVSRETSEMDEYQITSATIESVLENGNDAIYGAIFWFMVAGPIGAIVFRMANTMDAMWGYKNSRFIHFGWCAAKLDDALGYLPARLTAISYALAGNTHLALNCWKQQAKHCESPNGGPVMTSGAGALSIAIGGPAVYHGVLKQKQIMGRGSKGTGQDIARACHLVQRSTRIWLVTMSLIACLISI